MNSGAHTVTQDAVRATEIVNGQPVISERCFARSPFAPHTLAVLMGTSIQENRRNDERMRRKLITLLASFIGFVFLFLGMVSIPSGLFSGWHVLIFGIGAFAIGLRFTIAAHRELNSRNRLFVFQRDIVATASIGSLLTFGPWSILDWPSMITWIAVLSILLVLFWLAHAEKLKQQEESDTFDSP